MAGTDVKDKPMGDSSVTDDRDQQWSDEDQQAYDAEVDKSRRQQSQSQSPSQGTKAQGQGQDQNQKSKARQRYEEWKEKVKDKAKKKVKEYAKKKAKQYAKKVAKKAAKEAAKTAAKETAKQTVVAAASAAGSEVPVVGNIAVGAAAEVAVEGAEMGFKVVREGVHVATHIEEITKEPGKFFNWWKKWGKWVFWALGLFIILLIIFALIIGGVADQLIAEEEAAKAAGNPLVFNKTCPPTVPNLTTDITCTLTATYPGTADDIIINDVVPPNADFVSSPQTNTTAHAGARVTGVRWSAKDLGVNLTTPPLTFTVTITLHPIFGQRIYNLANASVVGGSVGGATAGSTAYIPPSTDNCGGKYTRNISSNFLLHQNYGDPVCDYTQAALKDLLIKTENGNMTFVNYWYVDIIPYESSFNPNDWAPPVGQQQQIDNCGAWGLYQMGSSWKVIGGVKRCVPALPPPAPGKNGVYDRGDVNWQVQTTNAINYNRGLGCTFWYWSTYRRRHPETKQC